MSDRHEQDYNDFSLSDIRKSIASQVEEQLARPKQAMPDFEYVDDLLDDTTLSLTQDFYLYSEEDAADDEAVTGEESSVPVRRPPRRPSKKKNWFKRMPVWGRVLTVIGLVLLALLLGAFLYYQYLLSLIDIRKKETPDENITQEIVTEEETILPEEDEEENVENLETINEEDIEWNNDSIYRKEQGVYNFLLLGLDKQGGGKGRSVLPEEKPEPEPLVLRLRLCEQIGDRHTTRFRSVPLYGAELEFHRSERILFRSSVGQPPLAFLRRLTAVVIP